MVRAIGSSPSAGILLTATRTEVAGDLFRTAIPKHVSITTEMPWIRLVSETQPRVEGSRVMRE